MKNRKLLLSEDAWKQAKITSNTRVPMKYMTCNTKRVNVRIVHYINKGYINCGCKYLAPRKNGHSTEIWKNEWGFNQVVQKCKANNLQLLMNLDLWKEVIISKDSKFDVKCRVCPVIATTCANMFITKDSYVQGNL